MDKGRSTGVEGLGNEIHRFDAATHVSGSFDTTRIRRGFVPRMDDHESPSNTNREMFDAHPDTPRGALHAESTSSPTVMRQALSKGE
jgi:hypothetical protein